MDEKEKEDTTMDIEMEEERVSSAGMFSPAPMIPVAVVLVITVLLIIFQFFITHSFEDKVMEAVTETASEDGR